MILEYIYPQSSIWINYDLLVFECVSNCNKASKLLQIFCQYIFAFWGTTTLLHSMQCVRTKTQNIISRSFCDYLYIIACKSQKSSMKVIPCRDWFVECNKSIFKKTFNKTSFVLKYFAFDTPKTFKNL